MSGGLHTNYQVKREDKKPCGFAINVIQWKWRVDWASSARAFWAEDLDGQANLIPNSIPVLSLQTLVNDSVQTPHVLSPTTSLPLLLLASEPEPVHPPH